MNWQLFYLICFILGFAFSTLSFLTGTMHLHLPIKWHLHVAKGHATSRGGAALFNSFSIMAFLTWFGAMGYLLTQHSSLWFGAILAASTIVGIAGALLVFWFLVRVLLRYDVGIDPAEYEMTGVLGKVTSSIHNKGTGEIVFEQVGTRRSCGARSEDGSAIAKGTEVVVTRYERGIAYVRTWEEISGEASAAAGEATKQ